MIQNFFRTERIPALCFLDVCHNDWHAVSTFLPTGKMGNLRNDRRTVEHHRRKTGWCNLLEVSAETGLWKNAQLETAAISTYNLGIPVAGDLQAFSCIDAGPDKAFRLIEAGIRQNIGDKGSVYAGLRNIDMDHFTTPFTALFTNASHGNFPILSANFPLATYPLAALLPAHGILPLARSHLSRKPLQRRGQRPYQPSVPFLPRSDGMFNIGSLSYHIGEEERHHGYYAVGYALGSSPSETSADKTFNYALWTLIEQPSCMSAKAIWEPCGRVARRRLHAAHAVITGEQGLSE